MNFKDLIFVDTETTGLDCLRHEIIEIAWIVTTPDALTIKDKQCYRMLPQHIETAQAKALEINGYTEAEWLVSPNLKTRYDVSQLFNKASAGNVLVGQNVGFDEGFITQLLKLDGVRPQWGYHKVDTVALAWPLYATTELSSLKLESLCAHLNIPQERKHAADADVLSCYYVYRALMQRYSK